LTGALQEARSRNSTSMDLLQNGRSMGILEYYF
jgi:hypothetical protein